MGLMNGILSEGMKERGCDMEIERYEKRMWMGFGMEGVLGRILEGKKKVGGVVMWGIKVMGGVDMGEKGIGEDGRISGGGIGLSGVSGWLDDELGGGRELRVNEEVGGWE